MDDGEQREIEDRLRRQIDAYHEAALLFAAVTSRVPDLLSQAPRPPEKLASELGLNSEALRRVLRGLVTMQLCEELPDGRFALTAAGESLTLDSPSSLREKAMVVLSQYWLPWLGLMHCLKTGQPSFPHVFGASVSDWRRTHAKEAKPFYHYLAKEEIAHADDVLQSLPTLEAGSVVASIGGGYGGWLAPLLRGRPDLKGVVFDAGPVAEAAEPLFEAYGVADRVSVVAGDILEAIPVEADIYVLKSVLQQHDDADAGAVLENCRKAMRPGVKLIVVERLMPDKATDDPAAIMLDLHMMAITGGKTRTKPDMEALIAAAGLGVTAISKTYEGLAFIEIAAP